MVHLMVVMMVLPAWAMLHNMFNFETGWLANQKYYLVVFGIGIQVLQIWMMIEGLIALRTAKGNYPELPPIAEASG